MDSDTLKQSPPANRKQAQSGKANETDTLYRHMLILRMIPRRTRISTTEIMDRLEREHNIGDTSYF